MVHAFLKEKKKRHVVHARKQSHPKNLLPVVRCLLHKFFCAPYFILGIWCGLQEVGNSRSPHIHLGPAGVPLCLSAGIQTPEAVLGSQGLGNAHDTRIRARILNASGRARWQALCFGPSIRMCLDHPCLLFPRADADEVGGGALLLCLPISRTRSRTFDRWLSKKKKKGLLIGVIDVMLLLGPSLQQMMLPAN